MSGWHSTGPYVPEPLTERQHDYLQVLLQNQRDRLLDFLSDEERVALELMGAEEWLTVLTKWDATELIGSIERAVIAEKTRNRSARKARKAAKKEPSSARRKSPAVPVRRKWWRTKV